MSDSSDLEENPDLGDWADLSVDKESYKSEEPVKVEPKVVIPDDIRYTADHPKWGRDDSIKFYKNGSFKRVLKKR